MVSTQARLYIFGVLEGEAGLCGFMDIYSAVIFLCPLNIEDGMIWSRISMDMHMELDLIKIQAIKNKNSNKYER